MCDNLEIRRSYSGVESFLARHLRKALACCFTVLGFDQSADSKALAFDTLHGLSARMASIGADHAALKDAEDAFNGIGRGFATAILTGRMIGRLVIGKVLADTGLHAASVRH